jgi:hypothetical protein
MRSMNQLLMVGAASAAVLAGQGTQEASADSCNLFVAASHSLNTEQNFNTPVLSAQNPANTVELTVPRTNTLMIDPLVIECGQHIVGYLVRAKPDGVISVAATNVQITEYIGHKAISIPNPQQAGLIVPRTLRGTNPGAPGVAGFTDGHTTYGFMGSN